jgi:predicted ATPase
MSFRERVEQALASDASLTLRSNALRDSGEEKLEYIVERLFERLERPEIAGPIYSSVRELVQNANKANIKRVLFEDLQVNPDDTGDYQEAMTVFRRQLIRTKIGGFVERLHRRQLFVDVNFRYSRDAVAISVRNAAPLYSAEEARIRAKFRSANSFDNLYDFYLDYGDQVEGAGMGIAMVLILLAQMGLDSRLFTIFADHKRGLTVSRLIAPLRADYRSPRRRFAEELAESGLSAEELRARVRTGEFKLPLV